MYRTAALGTMIAMAVWAFLGPKRPAAPPDGAPRGRGETRERDEAELAYWSAFWNGEGRNTSGPSRPAAGRSLRAAREAVDDRLRDAINRQHRAA
jgi:hypothetical protein